MEFPFDVRDILPFRVNIVENDFVVKDAAAVQPLEVHKEKECPRPRGFSFRDRVDLLILPDTLSKTEKLGHVINVFGNRSAAAQNLVAPITSAEKLMNSHHRLYLLVNHEQNKKSTVVGILKVGHKELLLSSDEEGAVPCYLMPLCLLDFYVYEQQQRCGHGRHLFDAMLEAECLQAARLAIDRPSPKLLTFLEKHFVLRDAIPQYNNFLVFRPFFVQCPEPQKMLDSSDVGKVRSRERERQMPKGHRTHSLDSASVGSCLVWWGSECDWKQSHIPKFSVRNSQWSTSQSPVARIEHKYKLNRRMKECSSMWNVFGLEPPCERRASFSGTSNKPMPSLLK